jgi:DNA-binding HxlR family transcriptional regulator
MSIREYNLRLVVIDETRVLLLDGKKPPEELYGKRLHAALNMLDIGEKLLKAKAKDVVESAKHAEILKRRRADLIDKYAEAASHVTSAEEDVIEPAPERHPVMPQGITRNVTTRKRYLEFANALLHGTSYKVLRGVAEIGKPVLYNDVREHLPDMKGGTISSQLHGLARRGFLLKQKNITKHAMIYTLTPEGEDILTRPEPQRDLL